MDRKEERQREVTEMLIDVLGLEDVDPQTVQADAPLFLSQDSEGRGLGLDSVDALEIVVALRTRYGLKLKDDEKHVLRSIASLADYIDSRVLDSVK